MNSLDAEALADNLLNSSHGRFGCTEHPRSPNSEYHMRSVFSSVQPFRRHHFSLSTPQTGLFIVEQATVSEGANFSFCICSNARFQICNQLGSWDRVIRLKAEFDTVDLLPQDLVSAYILRECLLSRDTELEQSIDSMVENLSRESIRETLE